MKVQLREFARRCVGMNSVDQSHRVIVDGYNSQKILPRGYKLKYTDEWCMGFVSYCAISCDYPQPFPYECGCEKAIQILKNNGMWIENDAYIPTPNDLIFYDWNDNGQGDCTGWADHVGIVDKCDGNEIVILEGNYNKAVRIRRISINARYIRGFGKTSEFWLDDEENGINQKSVYDVAMEVVVGKWGNGTERRKAIEAAGYDYDAVQAEVNAYYTRQQKPSAEYNVMAVALEVYAGKWGNNPERRIKLTEAGYDYEAVQEIVNNFYRGR